MDEREIVPWKRNLYLLFAAQLVSVIGFAVIFPFLPLYVEELGVRTVGTVEFWAAMAFSVQALTMGIASPIWGALADRWGRKVMVERALIFGAITLTLMGFVRSAEELAVLRAIQGATTGVIAAASSLVAAYTPCERSGWALGLMQSGLWGGAAVGPLVGGLLADQFGFHSTFKVTGILLLLSWFTVHRWVMEPKLRPQPTTTSPFRAMVASWRTVWRVPEMPALYGLKFSATLGTSILLPVAPLFVASLMPAGARVATVAGLFTAATAAASTFSGVAFGAWGDKHGHRPLLIGGALFSAIAYTALFFAQSIPQLIAIATVAGVANGAIIPSLSALMARAAPEGQQGAVYGLDASINSVGRMVAPLVGSAAAALLTLRASFAMAGAIYLVTALLAVWWLGWRGEQAEEQPVPLPHSLQA